MTNILKMSCSRIVFPNEADHGEKHRKLSDNVFMGMMANCSLEPTSFTHEAHIRLAWLIMNTSGFEASCEALCSLIERFDRQHGDGNKFDRRLTLAAAEIIWDYKLNSRNSAFWGFMHEYPELKLQIRELTARYRRDGH